MPTYRVFYAKPEHTRETFLSPEAVTRDNLMDTHEPVMLIHCEDEHQAFARMQGESMTPEEAAKVAGIAGRTSMSIGDALYRLDGTILVAGRGLSWHEHAPQEPTYPPMGDESA